MDMIKLNNSEYIISLIFNTNSKLHYTAQDNPMNLRTALNRIQDSLILAA